MRGVVVTKEILANANDSLVRNHGQYLIGSLEISASAYLINGVYVESLVHGDEEADYVAAPPENRTLKGAVAPRAQAITNRCAATFMQKLHASKARTPP